MINTTQLNERSMKIVAEYVARVGNLVNNKEIKDLYPEIVRVVDGSPGAERLWRPHFIVKNLACKTDVRGLYNLGVFFAAPEAAPIVVETVEAEPAAVFEAPVETAPVVVEAAEPVAPEVVLGANGKPLSMTPDAIRKRAARAAAKAAKEVAGE